MNAFAHSLLTFPAHIAVPAALVVVSLALLASPYPYIAPVPGLAVLFLLWFGRHSMRALLFYGIVALIPFGSFRGLGGNLDMIRLHWILAATLAVLVAADMVLKKSIPAEWRHGRFWAFILGFYVVNLIATLGSRVPDTSAAFVVLLAAGYLLVALGMVLIDERGYTRILPRVIVGSMVVSSVMAMLGYTMGIPLFVSATSGRVIAGAPDPNNLSLMIIFSLPIATYFLLAAQRPWTRLVMLLLLAIHVSAVISTFSRGGAIILGISLLIILWEFRRMISPRNLGLLTGLGGLAVCLLLVLVPTNYEKRLASIRDDNDFAINRRLSYIVVARELFKERPLLGSGPDTYSSMYARTELGRSFKRTGETGRRKAHNTYIEVLIGTGIIGLAFFVLILVYAMRSFTRAQRLFLAQGRAHEALLTGAYRVSFITLLLYLFFFSDVYHKYLLLSLAVSQVAIRLATRSRADGS